MSGEVGSIFTDSEIYSSGNVMPPMEVGMAGEVEFHDTMLAFKNIDSKLGIVRHIAHMETRFLSLFITADNISTFSRSTRPTIRQPHLRRILDLFDVGGKPRILSAGQIIEMEKAWTGYSRPGCPFKIKQTLFYTIHLVTYYLSESWGLVRDLCVISVAEDAFDSLIAESGLKPGHGKARLPTTSREASVIDAESKHLMGCLSALCNASAQGNLLAAISRTAGFVDRATNGAQGGCWFKPNDHIIWALVSDIYKWQKRGELEPEVPFLRVSKSHQLQKFNSQNTFDSGATKWKLCHSKCTISSSNDINYGSPSGSKRKYSTSRCLIPPLHGNIHISTQGAILVHAALKQPVRGRSPSDLCVYIVRGRLEPPRNEDLGGIISKTFADCDVYHTTRDHRPMELQVGKRYHSIWNIQKTYGVFFLHGGPSFSKWLRGLRTRKPTRQGSLRGPNASGRSIFDRNFSPWKDPRFRYLRQDKKRRIEFQNELIKNELAYWADMASEKLRKGIRCCALCAKTLESDDEDDKDDKDDLYARYFNDWGEEYLADCYDEYSDEWDKDCKRQGYLRGLCLDCQANLDISSSAKWPSLAKKLRKILKQGVPQFSGIPTRVPAMQENNATFRV